MQTFLVGGAVRDKILKYPVTDKDWVVVGATSEKLIKQGYKPVGKDFPVFLHPETAQEFALARTERKSGKGYKGFEVFAEQSVTLEEDLVRRDLTINAMAMDDNGDIVDPFNGQKDLKDKILRHVSPAFSEDPLRVLRVARFLARYFHLGFSIAPSTKALMTELAKSGELKALTPERVWTETARALSEKSPHVYFQTLRDCGALSDWFPEIDCLWGVPNPARWHPEIDTGVHTMMVLEQSALLSKDIITRFSALCHDLGKGITPKEEWPSHKGHEKAGVSIIDTLCNRLRAPKEHCELAKIVSEFHLHLHKIEELKPKTIVNVLEKIDAFRKPERFEKFLIACEADYRGRTGFENLPYPQSRIMKQAFKLCLDISTKEFVAEGYIGKQIGAKLHNERVKSVAILIKKP
jgi:tRNA nucleotidyltransferase (CCA-adding enzyme)